MRRNPGVEPGCIGGYPKQKFTTWMVNSLVNLSLPTGDGSLNHKSRPPFLRIIPQRPCHIHSISPCLTTMDPSCHTPTTNPSLPTATSPTPATQARQVHGSSLASHVAVLGAVHQLLFAHGHQLPRGNLPGTFQGTRGAEGPAGTA